MENCKLTTHHNDVIKLLANFIHHRPVDFPGHFQRGEQVRDFVSAGGGCDHRPCLFLCDIRRALPQLNLSARASHQTVVLAVELASLRGGRLELVDDVLGGEVVFEDCAVDCEDHEVV